MGVVPTTSEFHEHEILGTREKLDALISIAGCICICLGGCSCDILGVWDWACSVGCMMGREWVKVAVEFKDASKKS